MTIVEFLHRTSQALIALWFMSFWAALLIVDQAEAAFVWSGLALPWLLVFNLWARNKLLSYKLRTARKEAR